MRSAGTFSQYDPVPSTDPVGPAYMSVGGVRRVIATGGPFRYDVFRTPGYPAFLAGIYAIFGEADRQVVLIQCLLGAATISSSSSSESHVLERCPGRLPAFSSPVMSEALCTAPPS